MTLREFLQALRAGRYLIIAAVIIVVGAAVGMLLRRDTVYESRAVIQLATADDGGATGATFAVNADLNAVRSSEVVGAAALTLSQQGIEPIPTSDVRAELRGSDEVDIFASASSPEQAEANANAFADAFVIEIGSNAASQIAELDARRGLLRDQLAVVDAQLVALPGDPLATAERETIIMQYQALSAQASVAQSIIAPGQVVELAQAGAEQGVSESIVLGAAVLAGLLAGVGLALMRRAFDTRVDDADEARELAGSDVLADLFGTKEADRDSQKSGVLPVARRAATPFTEAIRQLRTTTQVAVARSGRAMVAVTTADRSAPREFIAANLAASFALSGRPTIIVRGDLRQNALVKLLPFEQDTPVVGAIRPTTIPNLSYYELPESSLDPADYLATGQVRSLLANLREEAEIVVVDAPPLLAAADATIIGGQTDGVVLIVTASKTNRLVLTEAAARLRKNHLTLLGLALTGMRADRALTSASTYGDTKASLPKHAVEQQTNDARQVGADDDQIQETLHQNASEDSDQGFTTAAVRENSTEVHPLDFDPMRTAAGDVDVVEERDYLDGADLDDPVSESHLDRTDVPISAASQFHRGMS